MGQRCDFDNFGNNFGILDKISVNFRSVFLNSVPRQEILWDSVGVSVRFNYETAF